MTQKGTHTWDLVIDYHLCPKCCAIIESRTSYEYLTGRYQKEIECDRCHHRYIVFSPIKPSFGPLIGDPQPPEIEWR